jgi:hypothetical protein
MTAPETRDYLQHHLALVGRTNTMFSDDAADLIHHNSRGLPRAVNNIALQALVATYIADKTIVDESAARAAVTEAPPTEHQDVTPHNITPSRTPHRHPAHQGPLPSPGGGLQTLTKILPP